MIADNLEACDKVYGYRVDNVTDSTFKLVEEFKMMNHQNISSNSDSPKQLQKFKVKIKSTEL